MPQDIEETLQRLGIKAYDEDIFEMSYSELRGNFGFDNGGLNSSLLIKNIIWQDHGKISRGELEPSRGNIRSYWYSRVKPVLARGRAKKYAKKYDMVTRLFRDMVLIHHLFD